MSHIPQLPSGSKSFFLDCLLDNVPDSIFFKDVQSRFILINHAAARHFGLGSPEEAIGKTDFDMFTSQHAHAALADELNIIETGVPIIGKEEKETFPNGTVRWAATTKLPLRNAKGKIIGTFGISRDITENVRDRERMAEQATLIDIVPNAIIVTDLQHHILVWNKGAHVIYGYPDQEAMGRHVGMLLCPSSGPDHFKEIIETAEKAGNWNGEARHVSKSKQNLFIDSRVTLVRDGTGLPQSFLFVNTDITEKKQTEAKFMRTQRLESIGVLAGGIAHDFNNILTPILLSIGLLKDGSGELNREVIDTIELSTNRGAAIVKQLLSFAQGVEGERVELQIKTLFHEVEQIIKDTFPKNIQLCIEVPQDLRTIKGDFTQLLQVLLNLCVNARDAMPNGGRLALAAANCSIDQAQALLHPVAKAGPYVVLKVIDSGTGIDPTLLEKIFEPFFTTKEPGKGTGLGLSTTIGIMQAHEGFMVVESSPGQGTTFQLHLPAEGHCECIAQALPKVETWRGDGETILVVDDDPSILSITRHTLTAFGYNVLIANNGAKAVALYAQKKAEIAAIITDIDMPVLDGWQAVEQMKLINPEVRIIVVSGLEDNNRVEAARNGTDDYFISKPYSTGTLLETLHSILGVEKSLIISK